MSQTRTLTVSAQADSLRALAENHSRLAITMAVSGGNGNRVIWQSKSIAPRVQVRWTPRYALNWTQGRTERGMQITLSGNWQECALGSSYTITPDGMWQPSGSEGNNDAVTAGCDYEGNDVHLIVGCHDGSDFRPIWIDNNSMGRGMRTSLKPQPKLRWWWQEDAQSGTVVSEASGPAAEHDFSSPSPETNQYSYSTTFHANTGTWTESR